MKTLTTEVLADGFYLLQSPRWHTGHLWMSDVAGGTIYRLAMDGRIDVMAEIPHRPSGLGFLPDGSLLIVSMKNRSLLRLKNDTLSTHCDLSEIATGELNEMFVDRHGRAYVGSFDWSERVPRCFKEARLILVTPDGKPPPSLRTCSTAVSKRLHPTVNGSPTSPMSGLRRAGSTSLP